jgi:hypothetical protein
MGTLNHPLASIARATQELESSEKQGKMGAKVARSSKTESGEILAGRPDFV